MEDLKRHLAYELGRWDSHGAGKGAVVAAACDGLAAGLWSQALAELAGARADDPVEEIAGLVERTTAELGLREVRPEPERGGRDRLRLVAEEASVAVQVNGETAADLYGPVDLSAGEEPRVVELESCGCRRPGCPATTVRIRRAGGLVHWDWLPEEPYGTVATFPADHYDAVIAEDLRPVQGWWGEER